MALVIETGAGLANADAYVAIAYVDAYNTAYVGNADWAAIVDTAIKERYIRRATQFINREYQNSFVGERGSSDQALEWPRTSAIGSNGQVFDSDEIPDALSQGTAEAALKLTESDDFFTDVTEQTGSETRKKEKVGLLEVDVSYVNPSSKKFFESINSTLAPVLLDGGSTSVGFVDRS